MTNRGQNLYIKNMVCNRCIMTVEKDLEDLSIPFKNIRLGEVELNEPIGGDKKRKLSKLLHAQGFELLEDKTAALIERIKTLIIEMVHYSDSPPKTKYSVYIAENVHHDYNYLSTLFSAVTGLTIEKFIILQKIERIKELLYYNEMNLNEITYKLGYSSVQHLSNQFKKETGMSPTHYKKLKKNLRKPLDNIT